MKFAPEHYPNSGIQHTRAVIAIGMAQVCLDCFIPEARHMKEKLRRIQKWINVCAEQTQKRRLSAGAKRAINSWAEAVNEYAIKEHMGEAQRDARWAALIWCAVFFCWDVRATCPEYRDGQIKRRGGIWRNAWSALANMSANASRMLTRREP